MWIDFCLTQHSQFTLLATLKKGNKPDFHQSASGDKARTLYHSFYEKMGNLYEVDKVKNGLFAAMMDVALVNDGPVGTTHAEENDLHVKNISLCCLLIVLFRLPFRSTQIPQR